jgi:hypothetical protein
MLNFPAIFQDVRDKSGQVVVNESRACGGFGHLSQVVR